ncbi:hypothetical protein [Candidatus Arthromitus sp. SFB-rat-Yit]|uniref:hypothetical protein n=1 Tax=Candidatus Arthromitus sp. SFB-rat-Yit TaxID=1041504 RepID=UPI000227A507|nr:hypothetical protein [Candidatus Arthromitus sp. SFB-rat-Yit]BAK81592.1 hypothetical protein RATSFB_1030 [Candidatus Arthromitus sp. SFB-rat-Yit]
MFKEEKDYLKINLNDSYSKNCESLFTNNKNDKINDSVTFNNLPVFKYKKLILVYDKLPKQVDIIKDVEEFISKININDNFKVFNIKIKSVLNKGNNSKEYIVMVALINIDIK